MWLSKSFGNKYVIVPALLSDLIWTYSKRSKCFHPIFIVRSSFIAFEFPFNVFLLLSWLLSSLYLLTYWNVCLTFSSVFPAAKTSLLFISLIANYPLHRIDEGNLSPSFFYIFNQVFITHFKDSFTVNLLTEKIMYGFL